VPIQLHCLSHTPVFGKAAITAETEWEVRSALAKPRAQIGAFDPDVVLLFAPDHYAGFFHGLMPPFCIGLAADSIGDYGSSEGAAAPNQRPPLPLIGRLGAIAAGAD